jgi:hypothetical protein
MEDNQPNVKQACQVVMESDGDCGDEDFQKRNGCLISLPLVLLGLSDDVLFESFSSSTEC